MATQQAVMPPIPVAPWIHRLGRVLVIGFYTSIGLAIAPLLAGAIAFTNESWFESTIQYEAVIQTAFIAVFSLIAVAGLIHAGWGLLQALFPAMFVPGVQRVFNLEEHEWVEVVTAGSTGTTARSVFNVCRRLRFWGICAIPFGLGMIVFGYALVSAFSQAGDVSPTLLGLGSGVPAIVGLLSGRDRCERQVTNQASFQGRPEGDQSEPHMSIPKQTISFREVSEPITELVTKFGGQPVWLDAVQWPLSRTTGHPMRFICQIALDPELFGTIPGRMVYIFMTDEEQFVKGTWEPEGGENAVIIQPGVPEVPTLPIGPGPTLQRGEDDLAQDCRVYHNVEYAVDLTPGMDPEHFGDDEALDHLSEYKISGAPAFLQGEEYPAGGPWRLLAQIDSSDDLFFLNFGDAGVGYAFLSADGTQGRFLWQDA